MQIDVIKSILGIYPSWTINDILNTDTLRLHEIMFSDNKKKSKKKNKKVRTLVLKEGGA